MVLKTAMDILTACPFTPGALPSCGLWEWAAISGLALSVSAVLLAFIYIWATLFRNSQLNAYVKSELYELVVTGVMVIVLFSILGIFLDMRVGGLLPPSMVPQGVGPDDNIYNVIQQHLIGKE